MIVSQHAKSAPLPMVKKLMIIDSYKSNGRVTVVSTLPIGSPNPCLFPMGVQSLEYIRAHQPSKPSLLLLFLDKLYSVLWPMGGTGIASNACHGNTPPPRQRGEEPYVER